MLRSQLLAVLGFWQRDRDVRNWIAAQGEDLTGLLGGLMTVSRDFHWRPRPSAIYLAAPMSQLKLLNIPPVHQARQPARRLSG